MHAVAVRLRFHGHPHHRGERARHPRDRPQAPVRWLGRTIWLGFISLGSFHTGQPPVGLQGYGRTARLPPTGHPERLVPGALTRQERILARELGWIRDL
ncbi:DUF6059 family protein [Streptomyces sp. NPDC046759]|uniref:DUF6059 family protein n=1 Tax=Streptomyces sp. NPDC046759 TaxID=3155019 RepID=UPI0033DBE5D2